MRKRAKKGENLRMPADVCNGKRAGAATAAALGLAIGKTVAAAAEDAGISERTVYTWLAKKPAFRQKVDGIREQLVDEATGLLSREMAAAATTLAALLKSDDEAIRLRAARTILEIGAQAREHGELSRRLADLEARLVTGGTM